VAERQATTGDQPRFSSKELTREQKPANLQYRVSSIRSIGNDQTKRQNQRVNVR
jgi:hypothetical protein